MTLVPHSPSSGSHQRAPVSTKSAGPTLPTVLCGSRVPRGRSPSPPAPTGPCTARLSPPCPCALPFAPRSFRSGHSPPRGSWSSAGLAQPQGLRMPVPSSWSSLLRDLRRILTSERPPCPHEVSPCSKGPHLWAFTLCPLPVQCPPRPMTPSLCLGAKSPSQKGPGDHLT